jgi:hypothetical protein
VAWDNRNDRAERALAAIKREPSIFIIQRWRIDRATGREETDVLEFPDLNSCRLAYKRLAEKYVADNYGEGPAQRWGICSPDVEEATEVATKEQAAPYAAEIRRRGANFGKMPK